MLRTALFASLLLLPACATLKNDTAEMRVAQGVFVACRAVDVYTTLKIVGAGGKELNPFMAGFVHSIPQFILIQALLAGIVLVIEEYADISDHVALGLSVASCLAPAHNLGQ